MARISSRFFMVLIGSLFLAWPAIYNRYPLLYPDSTSYLGDGPRVLRALFLRDFSDYYGFRSLIYSAGIVLLHWSVTAWPIVAFNAILTSYILWLLVRCLFPEKAPLYFFVLLIPLSLLTGVGWMVSWIMPDILGPVLYLSIYLLVFESGALSRAERIAVWWTGGWAITSHSTHLLLGMALCCALAPILLLRERSLRSLRRILPALTIIAAAVAAQLALNAHLYGTISLNGNRPPFLLARVFADGPGKWYLQEHCAQVNLEICSLLHDLPDNADDFLWGEHGWSESSPERQAVLQHDEMAVVQGAFRTYPRQELVLCARHFWQQLRAYGLYGFDPSPWTASTIDGALPGQGVRYQRSRQAQGALPEEFCTSVQDWTVDASLLVIAAWCVLSWRRWPLRLKALTALIAFVELANAAVAGNLSDPDDRYQARVIWLVPLLAGIFILTWLNRRAAPTDSASSSETGQGNAVSP